MSWLTNLIPQKDTASNSTSNKSGNQIELYISVDPTRVCFLSIDRSVKPNKIISWSEYSLGPIENLVEGEPVKDIFGSLLKLFTSHKEKFDNVSNVSVSIPAEGVFFKNVEVPKVGEQDRQKLILAEIKKTLPVDFSQVLFAQNDLGEKHENSNSYFCVGIQKMLFENYKNLFAKFNLNPYFEIEIFSLARIAQPDGKQKLIIQVGRLNTFLIFVEGQIIQDVRLLELGQNEINKNITKDLGLTFEQAETLKNNLTKLREQNRMGAKIVEEYVKDLDHKYSKAISLHIMEYEKKMGVEIQEVIISGNVISNKLQKILQEEFDAELKVDLVNESNFGEFVAENFLLEELKRYAQCFGLALRNK